LKKNANWRGDFDFQSILKVLPLLTR